MIDGRREQKGNDGESGTMRWFLVSRGEPVGNLQYALDLQELFDSELTKQQKQDEWGNTDAEKMRN